MYIFSVINPIFFRCDALWNKLSSAASVILMVRKGSSESMVWFGIKIAVVDQDKWQNNVKLVENCQAQGQIQKVSAAAGIKYCNTAMLRCCDAAMHTGPKCLRMRLLYIY